MALASTDAIRRIREYRQSSLFDPGPNWPEEIANERCWQQVGCDQLIERIRMNPFADPINVIEEYVMEMDKFADYKENNRQMFTAMKEVGETVGRMFV